MTHLLLYKCVLAIDPGQTTGLAVRFSDGNIETCVGKSPEEVYEFIVQCKSFGLQTIVIENFSAQLIGKYGLHTVRIVGGVHALCHVLGIEYVLHQPQDRYSFQQDAKQLLKGRRVVIHEQDALAHLLRYEHDNKSEKSDD